MHILQLESEPFGTEGRGFDICESIRDGGILLPQVDYFDGGKKGGICACVSVCRSVSVCMCLSASLSGAFLMIWGV